MKKNTTAAARRFLRAPLALAALLGLGACTAVGSGAQPSPAAPAPATHSPELNASCNAHAVQHLVGLQYAPHLLEAARTGAGARVVRMLWVNDPITKEYRLDRVNVEVHRHNNVISRVFCG